MSVLNIGYGELIIVFSLQQHVPHPVKMVEHVVNQIYVSVHQAGQDLNVK